MNIVMGPSNFKQLCVPACVLNSNASVFLLCGSNSFFFFSSSGYM